MINKPKIIAIVGSTASGKSSLAIEIAKKFNGEIISADSRQVYIGMDIGSNKVPLVKKRDGLYSENICHHLLNIVSPEKQFSVVDFKRLGQKAIKEILERNYLPIIVGGTGFYIDTLLFNLNLPKVPPQFKLRKKLQEESTEQLYQRLKELDPERAENINPNNKQRIIRALEIIEVTKKPVPKTNYSESPYTPLFIGLKTNRRELKERLKNRLELRIKKGLLKETEKLHKEGISWERLESFGLEYRHSAEYLQNKISKEEMKKRIENNSYKYAKRQITWFKRNKSIHWIKEKDEAIDLIQKFLN